MQYEVISLPTKIEYIREELKSKGDEGWELVCVVHQPEAYTGNGLSKYVAYFKKSQVSN